jgi:hypothetical protein
MMLCILFDAFVNTFLFQIQGISLMSELHLCGFVHVFTKSHIGIISFELCTM